MTENAKKTPKAAPEGSRKPTPPAPERAKDPVYRRDELQEILKERESWTAGELHETLARAPRRRSLPGRPRRRPGESCSPSSSTTWGTTRPRTPRA